MSNEEKKNNYKKYMSFRYTNPSLELGLPNLIESEDWSSPKIKLASNIETSVLAFPLFSNIETSPAMKEYVPPIIEASVSPVKTGISSLGPTGNIVPASAWIIISDPVQPE